MFDVGCKTEYWWICVLLLVLRLGCGFVGFDEFSLLVLFLVDRFWDLAILGALRF